MGRFGITVDSLLEKYSRCLALLTLAKSHDLASDNDAARAAHLRKSIRADRSQVRRAYSIQLSLRGGQLDQGDSSARSSVRKAIKRLTSAIARLLRTYSATTSLDRHPILDYESLKSLSNASRIDTIKAIDELSLRISPTARTRQRASSSTRSILGTSSRQSARPSPKHPRVRSPSASAHKRKSSSTLASASTKLGEIDSSTSHDRACRPPDSRPTYPLRPYKARTKGNGKKLWGLFR